MSVTDELLRNAERYAEDFDKGSLPFAPATGVVIVTCMDARVLPTKLFGLEEGDAHVVRNAGGVVTDGEIRALAISQHLLGTTAVMIVEHTGCGARAVTGVELADRLASFAGERPAWPATTVADADDSVRASIQRVTSSPFLAFAEVRGFVYDVATGRLREVP